MGYNNILTIGADSRAMYVSIFILFRLAHPPLIITWTDISAEAKRIWRINVVILHFAKYPSIPFWMSRRLADKLEQASGVKLVNEENP